MRLARPHGPQCVLDMHGEDFSLPEFCCALPLGALCGTYLILAIGIFVKVSTLRGRTGFCRRGVLSLLRREPLNIVIKRWERRGLVLGIIMETAALISVHGENIAVRLAVLLL